MINGFIIKFVILKGRKGIRPIQLEQGLSQVSVIRRYLNRLRMMIIKIACRAGDVIIWPNIFVGRCGSGAMFHRRIRLKSGVEIVVTCRGNRCDSSGACFDRGLRCSSCRSCID